MAVDNRFVHTLLLNLKVAFTHITCILNGTDYLDLDTSITMLW